MYMLGGCVLCVRVLCTYFDPSRMCRLIEQQVNIVFSIIFENKTRRIIKVETSRLYLIYIISIFFVEVCHKITKSNANANIYR